MVKLGETTILLALRRAFANLRAASLAMRERWQAYEKVEARGVALLQDWLSPAQLLQFKRDKCFDVIGSDSRRRYRICYGTATNVYEMNERGRVVVGWCFRPAGSLVAGDVMLAQKIALETNERAALAVAKPFPGSMPPSSGPLPVG
ncbi:hypothetical protein [Bradyrhizobium lablabi]|uniref:hypothetical protein n=1 Tax=Bradyrhizobium lablabi TaxID=722472 RepID=UPI00390887CC